MRNPKPTVDMRLFKYVSTQQLLENARGIVRNDPDLAPHESILISPGWLDPNELGWLCITEKKVILGWIATQYTTEDTQS